MSKIKSQSKLETKVILELTEIEAAALNAISVYGADNFLKFFYENLGESYLKQHEEGLRSLFLLLRDNMDQHLDKAKEARNFLEDKLV